MKVIRCTPAYVIRIGLRSTVTVGKITGNRVTLHVDAPYLPVTRDDSTSPGDITRTGTVVLSRKVRERIIIAGMVIVSPTWIGNGKACIGVQAPSDVTIRFRKPVGARVVA